MKKHAFFTSYVLLISLLFLALLAFATSNANAADTSVAVVNIQKIMRESKAASAIRTQVQSKQKSFQEELDQKEKALQKEDQELAKQRSVLSQDAFEAKYKEFRQKAANAQQEVRGKRAKLDKGFSAALNQVQDKVTTIVEAVCKEKNLTLAIAASQVLYTAPQHDITTEVLKRLDEQLPSLTVNFN